MAKPAVDPKVLDAIKQAILEEAERLGVRVERIILFGSRARGEAGEESDYDILVILEASPHWRTLMKLQARVRTRLYRLLRAEVDLFFVDKARYDRRRSLWGSLEYEAAREGVVIA